MTQKLRIGGDTPSKLYLGADLVQRVYLGADLVWQAGYPAATMVLTMATTGATEEQRTVRVPFQTTAPYNINIDWGDGNTDSGVTTANPEHVYTSEGTYTIQVTGAARRLGNEVVNTSWSTKLRSVIQWGDLGLTQLFAAFRGYQGTSLPLPSNLLSTVTSLFETFTYAPNLTSLPDIATWDVSKVTTMYRLFRGGSGFTTPPDVSLWNTAKVQNMREAFRDMGAKDIPCDEWSIAAVTVPSSFDDMFNGTTLPTARYDALLTKWEAQAVKPVGASFHGGLSKYTAGGAAEAARTSLANPATNNWTIADGGAV